MLPPADLNAPPPGLARRLAAFLYEGVLLFGVLFAAAFVFSIITGQRDALQGRSALGAFLFVVMGLYFVWFWSRGGQTLALKTWHLRVVGAAGRPLTPGRALLRYLLSWLWFLPALVSTRLLGVHALAPMSGLLVLGVLAYAMLARLHPRRLLLHEALSATQTITQLPIPR